MKRKTQITIYIIAALIVGILIGSLLLGRGASTTGQAKKVIREANFKEKGNIISADALTQLGILEKEGRCRYKVLPPFEVVSVDENNTDENTSQINRKAHAKIWIINRNRRVKVFADTNYADENHSDENNSQINQTAHESLWHTRKRRGAVIYADENHSDENTSEIFKSGVSTYCICLDHGYCSLDVHYSGHNNNAASIGCSSANCTKDVNGTGGPGGCRLYAQTIIE